MPKQPRGLGRGLDLIFQDNARDDDNGSVLMIPLSDIMPRSDQPRKSFELSSMQSLAESIVYGALRGVEAKNGQDAVATLKKALDNVRPSLEVRSRRVGGSTYQVPVEVKPHRANTLALRWLVSYAKGRREKTMTERLMNEILDASNGLGAAVKRREDTHKMAESNRAFAHYRW